MPRPRCVHGLSSRVLVWQWLLAQGQHETGSRFVLDGSRNSTTRMIRCYSVALPACLYRGGTCTKVPARPPGPTQTRLRQSHPLSGDPAPSLAGQCRFSARPASPSAGTSGLAFGLSWCHPGQVSDSWHFLGRACASGQLLPSGERGDVVRAENGCVRDVQLRGEVGAVKVDGRLGQVGRSQGAAHDCAYGDLSTAAPRALSTLRSPEPRAARSLDLARGCGV